MWGRPTVAKNFVVLLAVFLALQVLQLAVGVYQVGHVAEEAAHLGEIGRLRPALLAELARRLLAADPAARAAGRRALLEAIAAQDALYRRLALAYGDGTGDRHDAELARSMGEVVAVWENELKPLLRSLATSAPSAARAALSRYESLYPLQAERLGRIGALLERHLQDEIAVALRNHTVIFILSLCFALVAAWMVRRQVTAPLQAIEDASRRIAGGDLGTRVPVTAQDEFGALAGAFNDMAASLEQQASRLASLQRVYSMISRINGAIVRLRERETLLNEACRIAVEAGGFRLAWIGFPDTEAGEIRVAARAPARRRAISTVCASPSGPTHRRAGGLRPPRFARA